MPQEEKKVVDAELANIENRILRLVEAAGSTDLVEIGELDQRRRELVERADQAATSKHSPL